MTSILTPPNLFKEYCLTFYNEMADILHARNKIFALHMDGELKPLAQLIGESKIDIIEAFTPPPMGNLTVPEARSAWSDKVIWVNFPETLLTGSDAKSVEEYTVNLLKDFAPGDNFILGCTENYPFEHWDLVFGAIGRVLERCGVLPLSF
jgi:hypothetical protein